MKGLAFCALTCLTITANAGSGSTDLDSVKTVCGKCHTTAVFEGKPRGWDRWNDVFADMTQRGATGTNEELGRVTRYFLENLTLVNINTSAAEEIAGILGVSDEVAEAIIERRRKQPFSGLADLRALPGVDSAKLDQRRSRVSF
jgi:competence ComEA-like helix-hairpin-helix protein